MIFENLFNFFLYGNETYCFNILLLLLLTAYTFFLDSSKKNEASFQKGLRNTVSGEKH